MTQQESARLEQMAIQIVVALIGREPLDSTLTAQQAARVAVTTVLAIHRGIKESA